MSAQHLAGMQRDADTFVVLGREQSTSDVGDLPILIVSAGVKTGAAQAHWQLAQWNAHTAMAAQLSPAATHVTLEDVTLTSLLTDQADASFVVDLLCAHLTGALR